MSWAEANITINGQLLSIGEAMTLRVALEAFAQDLHRDGLGDDEMGKDLCIGYQRSIEAIRAKLYAPK